MLTELEKNIKRYRKITDAFRRSRSVEDLVDMNRLEEWLDSYIKHREEEEREKKQYKLFK